MTFRRHLSAIWPYSVEVVTRYKAAWGGSSSIIVGTGIYVAVFNKTLSPSRWVLVFLLAAIFAQFWHGLMQFERILPRFEIRPCKQHFWGVKEQRGSSGTGYYFEVFNPSICETLECVRAELITMEPDVVEILPFALHIRHLPYCIAETFVNPRCAVQFDLATGPAHNSGTQSSIIIPGIMGGDRGYTNGVPIKMARYKLTVRVSARHTQPRDVTFELSVHDDNFLRCVEVRPFDKEVAI